MVSNVKELELLMMHNRYRLAMAVCHHVVGMHDLTSMLAIGHLLSCVLLTADGLPLR